MVGQPSEGRRFELRVCIGNGDSNILFPIFPYEYVMAMRIGLNDGIPYEYGCELLYA